MQQKITLTLTPQIDLTKPPNADLQLENMDEFTAVRTMLRIASQVLEQLAENAARQRVTAMQQPHGKVPRH